MGLQKTYGRYATGGFYDFTYSPKYPDRLTEFDRNPLLLFVNYNSDYNLISGINLHWLQIPQREKLIGILFKYYKNNENYKDFAVEFGRPLNFTWQHLKLWAPWAGIAWRRYFPNRIRNIKMIAPDWNYPDVKKDIILSDTQRIIGVTPEVIQRIARESYARKLRAQRAKQAGRR